MHLKVNRYKRCPICDKAIKPYYKYCYICANDKKSIIQAKEDK